MINNKYYPTNQVELRKKPDVIVATPGRMIDHLRNTPGVGLEGLEILMGFTEEVQEVVKMCPIARQTMLFSATMTHDVDQLAAYSLKRPVAVPAKLQQEFVRIRKEHEADREALLLALCKRSFKDKTIVFAREKRRCHRLRILFGLAGLKAEELHGNLTQAQRLDSLESFRAGEVDFLIATDLAGRGLDIANVEAVINFEVPRNLADYVHRVGRTARAGKSGKAVTLADDSSRTKKMLKQDIVRGAPGVVKRRVVPNEAVEAMRAKIEEWETEVDGILEEEAVERQMRIADQETDKARNLIEHDDEIKSRPKKSWFQSNQEKRETRETNPARF
ncbi:P-loop containing nucleoside triphosphate hydrolase protein [Baffinella frigidus]|nr:P-loop containing nucleoside triphosphate hydrolase protein [Cryptophyta sp. CCMP2293]